MDLSSDGSKGGREGRAGPNSFNFIQFLAKFGKIICYQPPPTPPPAPHPQDWCPNLREILDPPLPRFLVERVPTATGSAKPKSSSNFMKTSMQRKKIWSVGGGGWGEGCVRGFLGQTPPSLWIRHGGFSQR